MFFKLIKINQRKFLLTEDTDNSDALKIIHVVQLDSELIISDCNLIFPCFFSVYCPFPGYVLNGRVLLVGNMGMYDYRDYVRKVNHCKHKDI